MKFKSISAGLLSITAHMLIAAPTSHAYFGDPVGGQLRGGGAVP